MSAITGIFHANEEPVAIEHAGSLMNALEKYPADNVSTWSGNQIFLGCHAQWVTPESVGEKMPFYDPHNRLAITADAILDNRSELFEKLQVDPERRASIPDSQLILLAYRKWEQDAPKHLIGDFAFMIWDETQCSLFGARDFSGSRTLYFVRNRHRFAFCTTIQPLLSLPYVQKELNEQWLAEYLAIIGMIDATNASATPYNNIEQVPPSHSISIAGDKVTLTRYCTITSGALLKLKNDGEYVEAFQDVFQQAVNSRLRTHRIVGAQLSGGLDSGAVVSFAAKTLREQNKTIHTFSYIPPKDFIPYTSKQLIPDERPFIKTTVQHVGGIEDHYLDFEGKDSYSEIDGFLEMMEMPYKFFENSFWLKGMFEHAHEQGIGVLLNGDRGNLSISWGSALDYYAILLKKFKWLRLAQELNQYSANIKGPRFRLLPLIARVGFPIIDRMFPEGPPPDKFPILINPEFARKTDIFKKLKVYGLDDSGRFTASNIYKERTKHFEDLFQWNASNTYAAKLSLQYNLWKRDPTNDLRVIRFCLSVPEAQYVQNGLDRALVRRSTKDLLPDQVRLNQTIRGVQGSDWVHRMIPYWDTFINEVQQLIADQTALQFLNGEAIKAALSKVKGGARAEYAIDPDCKILMRSLIVYRYIKKFA